VWNDYRKKRGDQDLFSDRLGYITETPQGKRKGVYDFSAVAGKEESFYPSITAVEGGREGGHSAIARRKRGGAFPI